MMKKRTNLIMLGIGLYLFAILFCCSARDIPTTTDRLIPERNQAGSPPVKLRTLRNKYVELDNGIVKLTLLKQGGLISGVQYNRIDNVLEFRNNENARGYWDMQWSRNGRSHFDTLRDTSYKFSVVSQTYDQIEVSFKRIWNATYGDNDLPLNIDKRFVMLRGSSGFYTYAIYEHKEGWPALSIDETRVAFKLHQDTFHYMAISDERQRIMPNAKDRENDRISPLAYKEAVLLRNPIEPEMKGQVDDKYQYSCDNKDNQVHGWISDHPHVGFWVITPSDEFRAGSPFKPDLTSHVGPTSLALFYSDHYAGPDFGVRLQDGEAWKKVFGPVFIYLNSHSGNNHRILWEDAKRQYSEESKKWPYDFPLSSDFPHANERGSIRGRLLIRDRYVNRGELIPARQANIGLAPPGEAGSWQMESKGYQFWTTTDDNGFFTISGVRPDTYNLYAWVPGVIGDYKYDLDIVIKAGGHIDRGHFVFNPPRNGPTLWEIGIPDRSAAEFYIPDASPNLMNNLSTNPENEKFRQYGLWNRYTDLYPTNDLVYTVGVSDYKKDWFFAHLNRLVNGGTYVTTTWQIAFDLRNVNRDGTYTFRMALASASFAALQVRVNNERYPHFQTGRIGRDNAIARHGIHGQHWLYEVNISGSLLVEGRNTIYLRQAKGGNPFTGVMYDYLRLEGPPTH